MHSCDSEVQDYFCNYFVVLFIDLSGMASKRKIQELEEGQPKIFEKASENQTTVCNCKVAYLRPKYANLKEWVNDERNLYIGRAGVVFVDGQRFPKQQTVWANPYKIGKDGNVGNVLKKFERHIRDRIAHEPELYDLETLRNRNLGCWCVPCTVDVNSSVAEVCHGQVLMRLMSEKLNKT